MKFDEYYQKQGSRGADFWLGFLGSIAVAFGTGSFFSYLAGLLKFAYSIVTAASVGLVILAGIGLIIFHPRKFIGIGMLAPFVLVLIVFGGCFMMIRGLGH